MQFKPGVRLGPYELVGLLGRGGMGEVYRARDTRLGREVAVKILTAELSRDLHALARFEREARAVAALSHPNIVALYDVGRDGETAFAVTELLEGGTLRDRLRSGPVPARKAIEYVRAVSDAVAAAHGRGIVHRDLKPENVFVTTEGRIKVLDFGIAQTTPPASAAPVTGEHTTDGSSTNPGTIVGTVGYMAPEQVRGAPTDARTDVFALGGLLYELLTGQAAFTSATPADTVSAILSGEPRELARVTTSAGASTEQIVRRCLEKSADERFQSARDVSFALEAITAGSGASARGGEAARRGLPVGWIAAAVAALVIFTIGAFLTGRSWQIATRPAPTVLFSIPSSTAAFDAVSVSPDGQYIAYTGATSSDSSTGSGIAFRRLDSVDAQTLSDTAQAIPPFVWSPDAKRFGYFVNTAFMVRELNGPPHLVAQFPGRPTGASWGKRDVVLVSTADAVYRVPASGGAPEVVMRMNPAREIWRGMPSFLPDGDRFVYTALRTDSVEAGLETRLASTDGRELGTIMTGAIGAMYADGHLFFGLNGALQAQPFDTARGVLSGQLRQLAPAVAQNWRGGYVLAGASETGVVVFLTAPASDVQFTWVDRHGARLGTVGAPDSYTNFDVSPDGRRIAATRRDPRTGVNSLALIDVDRGVTTPITPRDEDGYDDPTWAPDGRHLAYRHGDALVMRNADGGPEQVLVAAEAYPDHFTRDGRYITYGRQRLGLYENWAIDILTPGAKPIALVPDVTLSDESRFSKNEKWVAYHSNVGGSDQVAVTGFPPTGERWQISPKGGVQPRWSRDGNELFYLSLDGNLMAVAMPEGDPRRAGEPRPLFLTGVTPSNALDQIAVVGDRFLVRLPTSWRGVASSPIQVLVNWRSR